MKLLALGIALLAALSIVRPEVRLEMVSDESRVISISLRFRE